MADRQVTLDVLARDRASRVFDRVGKAADDTGGRLDGLGRTMRRVGQIAAVGLVAGVGAAAIGIRGAIDAASDLNETQSKAAQIFGKKSIPALNKFAAAAATSLGESKQAALDGASTFAIMGKAAGLSGGHLVKFSTGLTSLAGDLASFHNASPEEAITAIGAAMRGEQEPIRRFGVLLDDASLRAEALRQGLVKTTTQALTPQQKVLAAHALILKQTSDAQGDFARTSGGLANQQRILKAQLENVQASIGQKLLPIAVKAATALNGFITQLQNGSGVGGRVSQVFQAVGHAIQAAIPAVAGLVGWFRENLLPVIVAIASRVGPQIVATFQNIGNTIRSHRETFVNLGNVLKAMAVIIGGVLTVALKALGPIFRAVVQVIDKVVVPALRGLVNFWLTLVGTFVNGAAKAFGWIPGIGGKLKGAAAAFNKFKGDVLNALNGMGAAGAQVGADFAAGLARGIAASGAPVAAAIGVANKVTAAMRSSRGFDEHSPSKVGIDIGDYFSQGIAIGIRKGGKKALEAVGTLVESVKTKLGDLKGQASGILSSVGDSVRGVIDVSAFGAPIVTGQDADGNDITRTPGVAETASGFATQAKAFVDALKQMAAKKLAPSLIAAVAAAGPVGGLQAAQAFAASSASDVASVNASIGQINSLAGQAGNVVLKTTRLPAEIKREEDTLATLRRIEDALKSGNVADITIKGDDLRVILKRAEKKADRR